MTIYGNRFDNAWGYSLTKPLHSETFLAHELYRQNINIEHIPFKFIRVRANGAMAKADIFTGQI
jgi:hypothetical protein